MNNIKKKIIMCGINFGNFYLDGIKRAKEDFELVGILSRGSSKSVKIASNLNVPLYKDIKEIDLKNVDFACVVVPSTVVGGSGTEITNRFLEKGISVIQEHPVHYKDYLESLKIAKSSNCYYYMNCFYSYVPSIIEFIKQANLLKKHSKFIQIEASCSVQVLYPIIEILGKILDGFRPWSFKKIHINEEGYLFTELVGKIRNIPLSLKVQNQIDPKDPDNFMHLMHRITLITDKGSLSLTDTNGEVVWMPKMYIPRNDNGEFSLDNTDNLLHTSLSTVYYSTKNETYKNLYESIWPKATKDALLSFKNKIDSNEHDLRENQYQLTASIVWKDIGEVLGPAEIIS